MKHNFKKLEIWKRSRKLVKEIYLATAGFPKEDRYGLTAQIRRSAVSIPSNIAEGCGRNSKPQLSYFLNVAIASNCELETQLYLSFDIRYLKELEMTRLTEEVVQIRRMLIRFEQSL